MEHRGVARTGAGGPAPPPWQKTGPLLGKSFFKKLINFNKKISVQNWHIFSPLSQKKVFAYYNNVSRHVRKSWPPQHSLWPLLGENPGYASGGTFSQII